jgi:hypothetical protein
MHLAQDSVYEFEKRRNVPVRYDRELVATTLKVMERVQEIRQKRERAFWKNRYVSLPLHTARLISQDGRKPCEEPSSRGNRCRAAYRARPTPPSRRGAGTARGTTTDQGEDQGPRDGKEGYGGAADGREEEGESDDTCGRRGDGHGDERRLRGKGGRAVRGTFHIYLMA